MHAYFVWVHGMLHESEVGVNVSDDLFTRTLIGLESINFYFEVKFSCLTLKSTNFLMNMIPFGEEQKFFFGKLFYNSAPTHPPSECKINSFECKWYFQVVNFPVCLQFERGLLLAEHVMLAHECPLHIQAIISWFRFPSSLRFSLLYK